MKLTYEQAKELVELREILNGHDYAESLPLFQSRIKAVVDSGASIAQTANIVFGMVATYKVKEAIAAASRGN